MLSAVNARRTRAALSVLAALVAAPATASAQLPDLVSDAPAGAQLHTTVINKESRRLLRFDSYVHNVGPGPLRILASNPDEHLVMQEVDQMVDGVALPRHADAAKRPRVRYEDSSSVNMDGHDHWHLLRAVRYSLWHGDGSAEVAPAEKVGFCLGDISRVEAPDTAEPHPWTCGVSYNTEIDMGVSAGWRDEYHWTTPFQWVNVSDVAPGSYLLRADADPDDVVREVDEVNPGDALPVVLPGYVAKAQSAAPDQRTLQLGADQVLAQGAQLDAPEFSIVDPPEHGTLDAGSAWFTGGTVTYTPDDPADPAPDTFRFAARERGSQFPLNPPTAAVSLAGGRVAAISGAPEAMVAGTSIRLSSPGGVTWSADTGLMTADGLYTAPATTGTARVRAVARNGTVDEVAIKILPVPPSDPAPVPEGTPPGDPVSPPPDARTDERQPSPPPDVRGDEPQAVPPAPIVRPPLPLPRRAIEAATAQRIARWVSVTTRPGVSGRLRVVLRRNSRTVSSCSSRVRAGESSTCRLTRPRRGRGALRVVLQLRPDRGRLVTRSVAIRSGHVH
jgi:hypothetical protein